MAAHERVNVPQQVNGFNFRDIDIRKCPLLREPLLRKTITNIAKSAAARTVTRLFVGVDELKERGQVNGGRTKR
jgi:hypothetical protein